MPVQGIEDFALSLLDYSVLLGLSLALGGVAWGLFVLRAGRHSLTDEGMFVGRCVKVLCAGAVGVALAQPLELWVTAWYLGRTLQQPPFPAFFHTPQFQGGMARALLAAGVAVAAAWLLRRPEATRRWAVVSFLAVLLAASGAWLSHAASRFDDRTRLMVFTALHQLGALVWVGGLLHLGGAWRQIRGRREFEGAWPPLLSRFSTLAMASVLLTVATGIAVAWPYVGGWKEAWPNLIGTNYGYYLLVKAALLAGALGLAALNFRAVRRWRASRLADPSAGGLRAQVPFFIQGETILALTIVLVASALLALPLSVDVEAAKQRATWSEVAEIVGPKWPVLTSPSHQDEQSVPSSLSPLSSGAHTAVNSWSEYNHDVAGLFLVVLAIFALAEWTKRWPWTRYWPLAFFPYAAFLLARSDPETWPLGAVPFWQGTLGDVEVLEHRLAVLLVCVMGVVEWRARSTWNAGRRLAYVFPVLCVAGGMLLLIHFHTAYSDKFEFLIAANHAPVAVLAVAMGVGRWLELRLGSSRAGRWAGFASVVAFLLVGVLLTFYREIPGA